MNQRPTRPTSPTHAPGAVPPDGAAADCVRLLNDVGGIRRRQQRECVRLLQELTPHLRAARTVERELDRHLARRFNVFRYLRDDELGLSQIVAELLDPAAEHGQGTTFLEAMLELLGVSPEPSDSGRSDRAVSGGHNRAMTWKACFVRLRSTATDRIRVVRERWIPGPRYIDVTVDIPTDDGLFCLALENKPYADDQPGQCRDYLEFLEKHYNKRCLLVYLPPRYRLPHKSSLSAADRERWKNQFRVLPYFADDTPLGDDDPPDEDGAALVEIDSGEDDDAFAGDDATDHDPTVAQDDAAVGDGASLADWFGTCCKLSDAERLRWFLREAQLFCQHHFGDSTMTDTEARYIHEYLGENPRHLHAAFAVARAWPEVKHDVCRRFLEHLRDRVEERVRNEFSKIADDLNVACHYREKKNWWSSYLCVYRSGWVRCEGALDLGSDGRTAVVLTCGGGPNGWHWGVFNGKSRNDMSDQERQRCDELEDALKEHGLSLPGGDHSSPQYQSSPRYQDWSVIVPELAKELVDGGGRITDHYVNGLLKIAEKAIPAIDKVEQQDRGPSASGDS